MRNSKIMPNGLIVYLLLLLCTTACRPWTTIGGEGFIDQQDLNKYDITDVSDGRQVAGIRVKSTLAQASVHARYNITAVDGLANGCGNFTMKIRYRDNGPGAHVHLDLNRTEINGPLTTKLQSFDSKTTPGATTSPNNQTMNLTFSGAPLDFDSYSYWLALTLDKTDSSGDPRLNGIQLISVGQTCTS